jgi:transposase
MKPDSKTKALDGIKKAQLSRRKFTLEFKAEVVRHKKAENLNFDQCGRKFDISGKQVQRWEVLYDAGELTLGAGRKLVSPEQAELARLRAELSRSKMEVSILKKAAAYFARESL